MTSTGLTIVDFHAHFLPPGWTLHRASNQSAESKGFSDRIASRISDLDLLLRESDEGGIAYRVLSAPLSLVAAPGADGTREITRRLNDDMAKVVAGHRNRVFGLATIDAFSGDAGAREAHRAVVELGLSGLFLDSAKGNLLLDAPRARPTLDIANELGVPVFVHPINPEPLSTQLAGLGRLGTRLSRGTINAATLLSLVTSGTLDELRNLKIIITTLGISALALTGTFGVASSIFEGAAADDRRHVYIDTMGVEPRFIRYVASLVGADHLLAGSDWPILGIDPTAERLTRALHEAGLTEAEQRLVAGETALELLASGSSGQSAREPRAAQVRRA